jgi:hypothetical protein
MENVFGGLIEFDNKKEFELFVEKMDINSVIQIIEASVTYGLQNGLYTLEESHILYKCLSKLKEREENV